jgi:hypothetical protein
MKDEILLFFYYNSSDVQEFKQQFNSNPPILGVSVYETIDYSPLYNNDNVNIGNIQFNNINKEYITYPSFYNITENIQIQLDGNTSISCINYFKGNTIYYPTGSKYILPIISCTGIYAGKSGFLVIDALDGKRLITIKLE